MEIAGVSVFYLVPVIVFGPILFAILWTFGLKDVIRPPAEVRENRRRFKESLEAEKAKRKVGDIRFSKGGGPGKSPVPWVVQAVLFGAFMAFLGMFSSWPQYSPLPADTAVIKLSLSHPGQHKEPCIKVSRAERAQMASQKRASAICSRERFPVTLQLDLNGETVFDKSVAPRGLADDGPSSFYQFFEVPAGMHRLAVRMRDGAADSEFNYTQEAEVNLAPSQSLVVTFRRDDGLVIE